MRSFVNNVVPLDGRRVSFEDTPKCRLFIAFLTASVNDDDDETDCIGWFGMPLVFANTLELIEDTVWHWDVEIVFDDDDELINVEVFDWSDETISANGVHRRFVIDDDDAVDAESVGATKENLNSMTHENRSNLIGYWEKRRGWSTSQMCLSNDVNFFFLVSSFSYEMKSICFYYVEC